MGVKEVGALVTLIVLAALCLAPSAQALGKLPFQALLNPDGSGRIFMNNHTIPSWKACRPDLTACTPFAVGNFDTADAPPETVFWGGGELVTPIWEGNLHESGSPSVRGQVRGNNVVVPVAGQWAGGWATDYDSLSLSICKTAAGEHCLEINYEGIREDDCGSPGAKLIDPAFTGRYLRVVDRRYGSGSVFTGVGHPAYYPIPMIQPEVTASTAIVGKIAPATGPPKIDCGPPPLFEASIAADGSAEVACHIVGCEAILIAQRGRRRAQLERGVPPTALFISPSERPTRLRLTLSSIERLGGGPLKVSVKVNGQTVARRTVGLGPFPVVAEFRQEAR